MKPSSDPRTPFKPKAAGMEGILLRRRGLFWAKGCGGCLIYQWLKCKAEGMEGMERHFAARSHVRACDHWLRGLRLFLRGGSKSPLHPLHPLRMVGKSLILRGFTFCVPTFQSSPKDLRSSPSSSKKITEIKNW